MKIVYTHQDPPETFSRSLFLVGPTHRDPKKTSWRVEMLRALEEEGFDGVVFVPEFEKGAQPKDYVSQVEWENTCLNMSDLILAWVPRSKELLGFTTNVEFGSWLPSGKLIYGHPENAIKVRYLDYQYEKETLHKPLKTLRDMAKVATERTKEGALRSGGEREVPLFVWNSPSFINWYLSQSKAGNRLEQAKLLWNFRVGPQKSHLFSYTLWAKMWVSSEKRYKENEYVFSRTDISCVVAYYPGDKLEVLFIREFRTPARTSDGFVHELPGGSSKKSNVDPKIVAAEELKEETGIQIPPSRFYEVNTRQLVSTLSSHTASVYAVELTEEERIRAKALSNGDFSFGVINDGERTYLEIKTLKDIFSNSDIDWSVLGMVIEALQSQRKRNNKILK